MWKRKTRQNETRGNLLWEYTVKEYGLVLKRIDINNDHILWIKILEWNQVEWWNV